MRLSLVVLAALAATFSVSSASADAPPDRGFARRPVPSRVAPVARAPVAYPRYAGPYPTRRHHHGRPPVFVPGGPAYGREPVYYPGMGDASPNAGSFESLPVTVTQYREAYIGRGLIYNVPPQPSFPGSDVISVRY